MAKHRSTAQIDLLNAAVGAHIGRGAGGDQLTPVQNDDPIRMGEDHVHVVLGEQHADLRKRGRRQTLRGGSLRARLNGLARVNA